MEVTPGEKVIRTDNRSFISGYAPDSPQIATHHSPMNETEVMHGLDRENALRNVEPCHVL